MCKIRTVTFYDGVGAEPSDFDSFWSTLAARAHDVDTAPLRTATGMARVEEIRFTSLGDVRLGGWLELPDGPIRSAVIVGHGYGGRDALETRWAPEGAAVFYPVSRGLPTLSLDEAFPSLAQEHVLHGIASRETYVHGGCAADLWCAISALEELLDTELGESKGGMRLGYYGPSFGGGIGAMGLPWDERVDAASLYVPSFGANRERLAVSCAGSGAAVSAWVAEHPQAWEVLAYFDAATSAARITIPTILAVAKEDPAVPPIGQYGIADAVPEPYRTVFAMTAGHRPYPEEEREMADYAAATRTLFAAR